MPKQREIRDPIHGFVQRSELEESIIDTSVFQRLRGVKQLALANFVYPGALHTRFDHSVGVMHVAGRLSRQLIAGDQDYIRDTTRLVRLAALLHDIGHGPFSHVSEDVLDRYYDSTKVAPRSKEKIHEHLTCTIIENNQEISRYLSQIEKEKIVGLLLGTTGEPILRGIISGPLDADKQDYLLRDSYFCGVKYGVFDWERLIGTLQVYRGTHEELLAANFGGIYAIEQFVLAKYHMSTQVYRHKIRLISDAMIVRALELGIEIDELDFLQKLYAYDGSEEHIHYYLTWDDARLTTSLLYPMTRPGLATEIFKLLQQRRLFKRVFSRLLREIPDAEVRAFLAGLSKEPDFRKKVEQQIAEYLSSRAEKKLPYYHVIVNAFSIKSVREQSRNNEGSILILTDDGIPRKFEDESTLFRSIDERVNDQFVDVYAPFDFKEEGDKRKKKEEFSREIGTILTSTAKSEIENRKGKTKS